MRRAAKVDQNHGQIVKALRQCGWYVLDTHAYPSFVDAVAYHPARDVVRLCEIKAAKGRLTASQSRLLEDGWPVYLLRSVDDAIALR